MKPIPFPQANLTLTAPAGSEGVQDLPTWRDDTHVLSCWKASWRERLSILLTGKVWFWAVGRMHPPVKLDTQDPWTIRGGAWFEVPLFGFYAGRDYRRSRPFVLEVGFGGRRRPSGAIGYRLAFRLWIGRDARDRYSRWLDAEVVAWEAWRDVGIQPLSLKIGRAA